MIASAGACSPAGSTARCCSRWSASRSRPVWPIHVRAGLAWEAAEAARDRAAARGAAVRRPDRAVDHAHRRHARRLPAESLGRRRTAARVRHARRRRLPRRPQHHPDREGRGAVRAVGRRATGARAARRQSISRRDARVLRRDVARDVTGPRQPLDIAAPLAQLHKEDVVSSGVELGVPLELTLSCMNPTADGRPCGACSKCRERNDGLRLAGGERGQ